MCFIFRSGGRHENHQQYSQRLHHRGPGHHLHAGETEAAGFDGFVRRSYWIPGSYAPTLSEKGNSFLSLLKNKGFRKESMTKGGLDAIGTSTTLESTKPHL